MKKLFIILFASIAATVMGGCLNLASIFSVPNVTPIIISEPIITATEDQLYSYQLEVDDPNGGNLIYFLVVSPEGMSINSESGLISWTPANDQIGDYRVIIEISDGNKSITQSFKIEVINVNDPPQIFSYFPTNLNFEINEGNSIKFEVQAHDIDLNTTLIYKWLFNGKEVSSSNVSGDGSKSKWIYSAGYGDYSQKIVKVLVSDGELEGYIQWNITIKDIIPPAQPSLNTVISPTDSSSQILSGTKEINTSIWINGMEVISVNIDSTWSYSFDLSEGINNISITSRDIAGNESLSITTIIILDNIPPIVLTLNSIISPTNILTQILCGTKEVDTTILINGIEVIPINSETNWSYNLHLTEGTNSIFITSCDAVGNESSSISTIIVLDISIPEIPTLNDIITPTNISPQTFSGIKESNTSIWINNIEIIPINSSTNWTYDFNLSEGENNIFIISQDLAGNESDKVTAKITLDTTSPTIPTLNDVITPTNISSQILSGTKEINTSIWINGVEVISVNIDTTWSRSYNLSEGNNNISINSSDALGNESSPLTTTIEYDPNIYVNAGNTSGIEDGTKAYPFNTITEGIEAVVYGKPVVVSAGTYYEQLIINKSITLQGESWNNTFIIGSSLTGNLISIEADYITITGFTIDGTNSTAKGIYFDNCSYININNNTIQNNVNYGINYSNSSPTIECNDIKDNVYSAIDIAMGGAGIIRDNSIINNLYGIRSCGDSSPEITGNNISNNNTGIYCRESATPIISYNTISNNSGYGILIDNLLVNLVNPDIGGGDGQSDGQNKITGNSIHGVSNKTTRKIYAKYNWWGDAAGPKYPGNPNNATISSDWAYWDTTKKQGPIDFSSYLFVEP